MNILRRLWEYIKTVKYLRDWRYWVLIILLCLLASGTGSMFVSWLLIFAGSIGIMYGLDWYDNKKNK
jgi:hypothetical protein